MTDIMSPNTGLLYMKVGTHAQETLEDIITRKTKEIEDEGFALWGYGGNTCHPQTMVQPFAKTYEEAGGKLLLVMQEMDSRHFAVPVRADEYSEDGVHWKPVPRGINVRGSRYALVIKKLQRENLELPLAKTRVAIGNSRGRPGDRYISGRVDKACLEVLNQDVNDASAVVPISLTAELVQPYAVFVRNK